MKYRILSNKSGFTLLEVMISVMLSSSIIALLASSWWLIIRFDEKTVKRQIAIDKIEEKNRISRFINSGFAVARNISEPSFQLLQKPSGTILSMWISPGSYNVPDHLTEKCRMEIESGSFTGIRFRINCFSTEQNKANVILSETILTDFGKTVIEVLGQDNIWINSWTKPEHHGIPRAIRFRSEYSQGNILSTSVADNPVIFPLICADNFLLSDSL